MISAYNPQEGTGRFNGYYHKWIICAYSFSMRVQNKAYNHKKSDWIIRFKLNKYQLNIIKTINQ